MKLLSSIVLLLVAFVALLDTVAVVVAKKPTRSRTVAPSPNHGSRRSSSSRSSVGRANVSSRRRQYEEDEYVDEDEDTGIDDGSEEEDDEMFDEEEDDVLAPPPRSRQGNRETPKPSSPPSRSSRRPPSSSSSMKRPRERYVEDDEEEDYYRPSSRSSKRHPSARSRDGPPPRERSSSSGRRSPGGHRSGSVVPYGSRGSGGPGAAPGAFTRGLSAIRESIPDASAIREAAASSISAARETTSALSANVYREVKGLTSSELEQVMLKATRPDDTPVKGKHVERLVGVTYQISSRYDIYDAVLRKLWSKMAEKDWRTTIKALYILHRFSADGAPEHAPALKARLRELRRTRDPKRKDKYFNSKQLLAGDAKAENIKLRAFMSRYAHYVLLRAQCFGGMFDEISEKPGSSGGKKEKLKAAQKPITSTSLRTEHLEAAAMLLKAGVACQLKDGEECENTAIAVERVASDLIGLTTAVAIALNRALKDDLFFKGADPALLKRWCEFYSEELLPQSRAMVKKTSAKLDAYGLFLPSRMGASIPPELLQKGLRAEELTAPYTTEEEESVSQAEETAEEEGKVEEQVDDNEGEEVEDDGGEVEGAEGGGEVDEIEREADLYDEYEYEEEEYYDDEDVE